MTVQEVIDALQQVPPAQRTQDVRINVAGSEAIVTKAMAVVDRTSSLLGDAAVAATRYVLLTY